MAVRLSRHGFTVLELLVAMAVGVVVITAVFAFLLVQIRSLEGSDVREELSRNGRYLGISLRHDVQAAGIELLSTTSFSSLAAFPGDPGDTLMILHVPYVPSPAPPHDLLPPTGTDNPLPVGGTCGMTCLDLAYDPGRPLELRAGDLARLQVAGTRRLLLLNQVSVTGDSSLAVTFTAHENLLRQPAGLSNDLRLDRYSSYVQELRPILYYLDDQRRLWRAISLNPDGTPKGDVLAYGVEGFDVKLMFADGDEHDSAGPFDADDSNDYDDIVGVRIRATIVTGRADPRVNRGQPLKHEFEWIVSPRNLRYEKHR